MALARFRQFLMPEVLRTLRDVKLRLTAQDKPFIIVGGIAAILNGVLRSTYVSLRIVC